MPKLTDVQIAKRHALIEKFGIAVRCAMWETIEAIEREAEATGEYLLTDNGGNPYRGQVSEEGDQDDELDHLVNECVGKITDHLRGWL